MRWMRSWPAAIPPNRAYVVDELPRLVIDNYDYTPLGDIDDDVCVLEWDMALAEDERAKFDEHVTYSPGFVAVAPYKLYHVQDTAYSTRPVMAHRVITDFGRGWDWIRYYDQFCDYFGFGMIYLPRDVVREFLAAPAPERGAPLVTPGGYTDCRFHDQTFSMWYRHRYKGGGTKTRVVWECQPVHLHGKGV